MDSTSASLTGHFPQETSWSNPPFNLGALKNPKRHDPREYEFLIHREQHWYKKVMDTRMMNADIPCWSRFRRHNPTAKSSTIVFGGKRLPAEVIQAVAKRLDIASLFNLKATNSKIAGVIESWIEYTNIAWYARMPLRALLTTGGAHYLTIEDLVNITFETECAYCGDLGSFIYLLKAERVCFRCLCHDARCQVISAPATTHSTGLNIPEPYSDAIPSITTTTRKDFWGYDLREQKRVKALDYQTALAMRRPISSVRQHKEVAKPLLKPKIVTAAEALESNPDFKDRPHLLGIRQLKRKRVDDEDDLDELPLTKKQQTRDDNIANTRAAFDIRYLRTNPLTHDEPLLRFACAIYSPALSRLTTSSASSLPRPAVLPKATTFVDSTINAPLYCAGCKHFWNMHSSSAQHWSEHTAYTKRTIDSHLIECRFAWAYYANLRYPGVSEADVVAYLVKSEQNRLKITRSGVHGLESFDAFDADLNDEFLADAGREDWETHRWYGDVVVGESYAHVLAGASILLAHFRAMENESKKLWQRTREPSMAALVDRRRVPSPKFKWGLEWI